jgi:UDP-GlcNAc:undecaprenyl-phosphate/decaprenyl-phosphate GlcNAc-1-phosphate transferase
MYYLALFLIALVISAVLVPAVKAFATKVGAVDVPNSPRKIHTKTMPLLGGLAIYISVVLTGVFYILFYEPDFNIVPIHFFVSLALGGLILMIGGYLDDVYNLTPLKQFIFPLAAVLVVIFSGIGVGIQEVSNPFGAPIRFDFEVLGIPFSGIFVFLFIIGMIYTTKFLDGLDGLASGVSLIAGLTLFLLSLTPRISQSITASIAVLFCGAILGFLIYNFNPASIFLGEGGSEFLGFMLGVLAVLLGGKIATAVLVMGIPILDVLWVIIRRMWFGVSPFKADRRHLHFRLLDIGFSQRQTVITLYLISAGFGLIAVFLQSMGKLILLLVLLGVMTVLALGTVLMYKHKYPYKIEGSSKEGKS